MKRIFAAAIVALLVVSPSAAHAKEPPTDAEIRQKIIQDSIAA
jgi:hypothetical protein